jgi:hypothetical protein
MNRTLMVAPALLAAALGAQNGRDDYDELVAAYAEQTAQYRTPDAVVPPLPPDTMPIHAEFLAAAEERTGDDAMPFLGWILQNAPRNERVYGAAVAAIEAMAEKIAAAREDKSDDADLYKASRQAVRTLKYQTVSDAVFAKTLLDAKVLALSAASESIAEACKRSVFKLTHLREGMVAPDIVGRDLDGVEFKLSDYRGKVVVIDFWGDW